MSSGLICRHILNETPRVMGIMRGAALPGRDNREIHHHISSTVDYKSMGESWSFNSKYSIPHFLAYLRETIVQTQKY